MLKELIDAVNAYRLEHSACEASGHKTAELNDTYVRMLQVCDAAQQMRAADICPRCEGRQTAQVNGDEAICPECGGTGKRR